MHFFVSILTLALSFAAVLVAAQSGNGPLAIVQPLGGSYAAGSVLQILWQQTSNTSTVTLQLRYGSNTGNLATGEPIASKIANNGAFEWRIPISLASYNYAIQVTDSDDVTNYSPPFAITGGQGALSTASTGSTSPTLTAVRKTTSTASASGTVTSTALPTSGHGSAASGGGKDQSLAANKKAFAALLGFGALAVLA